MAVKGLNGTARIARKNERITFQKNAVTVDRYGNHMSVWTDYFNCSAYASTYEAKEDGNEVISEERSVAFEVRWCPELSMVTSTGYRIIFHEEAYDIQSVDMMNYQRQAIRFICKREKRRGHDQGNGEQEQNDGA